MIYEKWDKYKTKLESTITNPDTLKLSKMDGYLLVVEPEIIESIQKLGSKTFSETERSWEVVPKTQEERDEYQAQVAAEELSQANEALLTVLEASNELAYWVDKTPEEITTIITDASNTFASFKQMLDKNAQAVAAITKILKLLRDTGRLF